MVKRIEFTEREFKKIKKTTVYIMPLILSFLETEQDHFGYIIGNDIRLTIWSDNTKNTFNISKNNKSCISFEFDNNSNENDILDKLVHRINNYIAIKVCDCDEEISNQKFDKCMVCFVHWTENEEKCPICLETGEGVWVKNDACNCKSYYHIECYRKNIHKCPTCRKIVRFYDYL